MVEIAADGARLVIEPVVAAAAAVVSDDVAVPVQGAAEACGPVDAAGIDGVVAALDFE